MLRHKPHKLLPSVTGHKMVMSRNFFVTATDVRRRTQFYFVQPVTLGYDSCNLCHKSATKFRDKLQGKISQCNSAFRVLFCKKAEKVTLRLQFHFVIVFTFPMFMHETNANAKPSAKVKRFPYPCISAVSVCIRLCLHPCAGNLYHMNKSGLMEEKEDS